VSTTFAVAVKLRGVSDPRADDPEAAKLLAVLRSITDVTLHEDGGKRYRLTGGGGYGNPEYTGECADVVCLFFQKNEDGSGDLADCTEADRARVRDVLRAHPLVERFHVGALHSGEEYDSGENARVTSALVREYVASCMKR
jgi:hypothetical protein